MLTELRILQQEQLHGPGRASRDKSAGHPLEIRSIANDGKSNLDPKYTIPHFTVPHSTARHVNSHPSNFFVVMCLLSSFLHVKINRKCQWKESKDHYDRVW